MRVHVQRATAGPDEPVDRRDVPDRVHARDLPHLRRLGHPNRPYQPPSLERRLDRLHTGDALRVGTSVVGEGVLVIEERQPFQIGAVYLTTVPKPDVEEVRPTGGSGALVTSGA